MGWSGMGWDSGELIRFTELFDSVAFASTDGKVQTRTVPAT